jgi:type IX secretion system PorP/SprF family membrane protein
MNHLKSAISLFFLLLIVQVNGQDIHWSQYNDNPLFQNPGNTGNFNGDYRFVGNYRNQWRSVSIPFETIALSAEKKLEKYEDLSLGIQLFNDVVGDGQFRTTEVLFSLSIAKYFMDSNLIIRPGATVGLNQRRFDSSPFNFDEQFSGIGFDPSLPTGENIQSAQKTNITIALGASGLYKLANGEIISGGIALFNINRPNQGFFNEKVKRDRRLNINANYEYKYSKDLHIIPSFQINTQGKYREVVLGGNAKYILEDRMGKYKAAQAGLWYRNRDAAILTMGLYYQSWFFGLSYDINMSKLSPASNGRGGIEFALRYILHTFKTTKTLHRICPEYI